MPTRKQSQFELFPSSIEKSKNSKNSAPLFNNLTLTLEHIIVLCIVFVVMVVVCISFGVERGKRVAGKSEKILSPVQTTKPISKPAVNTVAVVEVKPQVPTEDNVQASSVPVIKPEKKSLPGNLDPDALKDLYTIQVASFKREKNAKEEAESLEKNGLETFVMTKGNYSIVCVGKFSQSNEAKKYSTKLKNKYQDLLVRRF